MGEPKQSVIRSQLPVEIQFSQLFQDSLTHAGQFVNKHTFPGLFFFDFQTFSQIGILFRFNWLQEVEKIIQVLVVDKKRGKFVTLFIVSTE